MMTNPDMKVILFQHQYYQLQKQICRITGVNTFKYITVQVLSPAHIL